MGVTQEEDLWPTEPSPKDIGDRASRKPLKIMSGSVTNVRDMPQIFINQRES